MQEENIGRPTRQPSDLLQALLAHTPSLAILNPDSLLLNEDGSVEIGLVVQHQHTNIHKIVHGGVLVTLLDTAMGYACHILSNTSIVTMNLTTSFIANCKVGARISAIGEVIHAGRRVIVAEGKALDEEGTLLATAQGTFFVVGEAFDSLQKSD